MKLNSLFLLAALINFSCQTQNKNVKHENIRPFNSCQILNGKVYTYLPKPDKERHIFTLKFECVQDTLKGLLFGPFPEGDHGLAFYKAEIKKLVLDDSSNVSFLLIPGKLYEEQITLENYRETRQDIGIDRGEHFFKGKFLADTAIVLNCSSEFYDCYTDEEMIFKLKR